MRTTLLVIGGLAALAAGILVAIMAAAGIGIFSANVRALAAKRTLAPNETIQVFSARNALQSQAYFESLRATYDGQLVQIRIQKQAVASDPSAYNKTNLLGLRQVCVSTAQEYNAAARSIASQAFRSADLPVSLNPAKCAS